ncbi:hypothetical protein ADK91_03030 [Streptomyces sp. XY511]|uniref:hypothetical protein n=1 Tax=Streptomyces sp. XY511 TaxID=1519480 RepID=UPI0006B03B32|nr:hypothetical protein [Streptomyces sp. XY511]KOV17164.1 hypothetical protein ADK91_03030 [Streptomyces sp. XY511]
MAKRYITESDEPGETFAGWFDTETAEAYEPSAGSPAFHERLWLSADGRWVIQTMPRKVAGRDEWRFIAEGDAQRWRAENTGPQEQPQGT